MPLVAAGGLHARAGLGGGGPEAQAGLDGTLAGPRPAGRLYAGSSLGEADDASNLVEWPEKVRGKSVQVISRARRPQEQVKTGRLLICHARDRAAIITPHLKWGSEIGGPRLPESGIFRGCL